MIFGEVTSHGIMTVRVAQLSLNGQFSPGATLELPAGPAKQGMLCFVAHAAFKYSRYSMKK